MFTYSVVRFSSQQFKIVFYHQYCIESKSSKRKKLTDVVLQVGVAMTDLMTALYAHGAILAALLQRGKTGRGQKIDCNLLSTQVGAWEL